MLALAFTPFPRTRTARKEVRVRKIGSFSWLFPGLGLELRSSMHIPRRLKKGARLRRPALPVCLASSNECTERTSLCPAVTLEEARSSPPQRAFSSESRPPPSRKVHFSFGCLLLVGKDSLGK